MVKVVSFFRRKPGMPVEEFQAYWRGKRPAPVVRLPGLRRYVQSHTRPAGYGKGEPIYDGIAELWFEDTKAMHALRGPLAAQIPVIRRYVQSHTRRSAYERGRMPAYDGVAITWFDDTQAMRASAATAQYARVRADEPNFIAPGDPPFIITTEHVVVA